MMARADVAGGQEEGVGPRDRDGAPEGGDPEVP
jgi:hypothetical protein